MLKTVGWGGACGKEAAASGDGLRVQAAVLCSELLALLRGAFPQCVFSTGYLLFHFVQELQKALSQMGCLICWMFYAFMFS